MSIFANLNLTVPIEIQRQSSLTDAYGQDRLGTWTTISTVNGWIDTNIKKMIEKIDSRDESNSDGMCFLPAGTDIVSTDRIVVNSLIYQVFGIPSSILDLTGAVDHIELRIRRYYG